MTKKTKLLQLVNLLYHRNCVTSETIQRVCDIPERTVYRYLNSLSESNIPVYFDKEAGGYKLVRQNLVSFNDLTLNDSLLLTTCLKIIQKHVNADYREKINDLLTKIVVRKQYPLEELNNEVDNGNGNGNDPFEPDFSSEINSVLIEAAIQLNKSIRAKKKVQDSDTTAIEFHEPTLIFSEDWKLVDRRMQDMEAELISAFTEVEVF
jgi:hypothetical protein